MNTIKTPECWGSDLNAHGVRIELSSEKSFLLPFEQFMFAEVSNIERGQQLRAIFVTHEIRVVGTSLGRIEIALQRRELSHLTTVSATYEKLIAAGHPVVREITVEERKEDEGAGRGRREAPESSPICEEETKKRDSGNRRQGGGRGERR